MKTEDLITALSLDLPPASSRSPDLRLALFLIPAAVSAFVGVLLWTEVNRHLPRMVEMPVYWAKAAYTLALAVGGFWLLVRLGRPGASTRGPVRLLLGVLALIVAVSVVEVLRAPPELKLYTVMGYSSDVCTLNVLILSGMAAPFVFMGARRFAPTQPALAGAAAGILSSGIAATLYGLSCAEPTAAFLAVWYLLGMGLAAAIGALIGSVVFRW